MTNKKIELLAPAKNLECAVSAINFGADAVYIGANSFGARQNASNNLDDIEKAVEYAHKFYAKIYCTVNTILTDDELKDAQKLIYKLYDIGVDAIIFQDMGLLKLDLPPIPLHASTQCNNRTLEKVKFFENIGIQRVILARELSLKQIKNICENTSIEIETFIHGALCVSYSGQCYMSEFIGNRSANRGCCAQPCRKKYSLLDEDGKILAKDKHLLSLKDFNASSYVKELINAGVNSFKIEGRLKDENYIKNVVAYYRNLIDKYSEKTSSGICEYDFLPDINKSFNRGFTTYCLDENRNMYNFETPKSMGEKIGKITKVSDKYFEYNGKSLNNGDGICFIRNGELEGLNVNRAENMRVYTAKKADLKPEDVIYRNYDIEFEKKLKNSATKRKINANIVFNNRRLTITDEDFNSVFIDIGTEEPAENPVKMKETFISQMKKSGESCFKINSVEILSEIPFMKISEVNALRRDIIEKLMQERLKNYKRQLQKTVCPTQFPEKITDYKANVHNKTAKQFYEDCGCKIEEDSFELNKKVENLELMRTKHCLYRAFGLCKSERQLYLKDEKNMCYKLIHDCKICEMIICKNL